MQRNRCLSAFFIYLPEQVELKPEGRKLLKCDLTAVLCAPEDCQLMMLYDYSFLLDDSCRLRSQVYSNVTLSLCRDQKYALRTISNCCDMIKRKLVVLNKKFVEENLMTPTREQLRAQLQAEFKRLWHYGLVVQRESRRQQSLISSHVSHAKLLDKSLIVNFHRLTDSVSEMIFDFLGMFHTLQSSEMPKITLVELNQIPPWVSTDWRLFKETLHHILALAMTKAGKFGQVTLTISFHKFTAPRLLDDSGELDRRVSDWGYLLTNVEAVADDAVEHQKVDFKQLLDQERDETCSASLGIVSSRDLVLGLCGAIQFE